MEDHQQLKCLVDRTETPGSEFFTGFASVVLGATLTCSGPPFPRPGTEMIEDLDRAAFDAPLGDLLGQPPGVCAIDVREVSFPNRSPVSSHFERLVADLSMPRGWRDEGIEPPSAACRQYSLQVLDRLFDTYGIIPYKITVSKDGGIFAAYKSLSNKYILRIEVDNELDVVAVVSDGDSILDSGLLEADDLEQSLINRFNRSMA